MTRALLRLSVSFAALWVLTGCNLEQRYLQPDGSRVYAAAITETTPAFITSEEDGSLFIVESRVEFPIHAPTEAQMADLSTNVVAPFASRPWVERGDFETELDLTVSNLEATAMNVTITVNGINEFTEYVPGASIVDRQLVIDFAQWERTYHLDAGERRTVTVREEELDEIAVDLASVVNVNTVTGLDCGYQANEIVYFMNQSSSDVRSIQCIPALIPGLVGVKIGIRVQGGTVDPMTMVAVAPRATVEGTVRLRDVGDRVATANDIPWTLPVPVPFTPLVMMDPVP